MATATVARPAQALRRPRPSLTTRSTHRAPETTTNGVSESKLDEPYVKDTSFILRKFRGNKPSLVVHLHPAYFRFDQQEGSFSYDSPMRVFVEHMHQQTVPHEMVEELLKQGVTFYDGKTRRLREDRGRC